MSDEIGPVVYSDDNNEVFLGKDYGHVNNYSEATSARIDSEIERLMKNAYEAMNETGTINLNIYQENDFIRIDIIDFGGGIPKEVENTLFDLFISSKPNGSGLGLAISKKIIEAHAGKLLYESRPGDGCTFSVLLPLHV